MTEVAIQQIKTLRAEPLYKLEKKLISRAWTQDSKAVRKGFAGAVVGRVTVLSVKVVDSQ